MHTSHRVLQIYKRKVKGAVKGHSLLKKKADALNAQMRSMLKQIYDTKKRMGSAFQESSFALAQAQWAAGDFKQKILDKTTEARLKVKGGINNVAGVKLPVFVQVVESSQDSDLQNSLGLARGGRAIAQCRKKWEKLIKDLIDLASLQSSFVELDEALKVTNRRVNALDNVVIPRLKATQKYVTDELDELEREENFRVKKVIDVKKEKIAKEKKFLLKLRAARGELDEDEKKSMLDKFNAEENDPDMLF
eukprot:g589.t1